MKSREGGCGGRKVVVVEEVRVGSRGKEGESQATARESGGSRRKVGEVGGLAKGWSKWKVSEVEGRWVGSRGCRERWVKTRNGGWDRRIEVEEKGG